jgi:hypothetical protein
VKGSPWFTSGSRNRVEAGIENYLGYYHQSRTHLGLEKDAPEPRPVLGADAGEIVAYPRVGGLHHPTNGGPRDLVTPRTSVRNPGPEPRSEALSDRLAAGGRC